MALKVLAMLALCAGSLGQEFPMMSIKFSVPTLGEISDMMPRMNPFPGFGLFEGLRDRFAGMLEGEPNFNGKDVKTEVKNETRGNMHITTIDKKGKNFHVVQQVATMLDGKLKNGSVPFNPLASLFGEDFEEAMQEDKKKMCSGQKPCPSGKYCDPLSGTCREQLPEGSTCIIKGQCKGDGITCKWGKCNKAKPGDAGTFCQKSKDCNGDASCNLRREVSEYTPICSPRLGVGSVCGYASMFGFSSEEQGPVDDSENPCRNDLKCIKVGIMGSKICVPKDLKEKTAEEERQEKAEADDQSDDEKGDDDDDDDDDDDLKQKLSKGQKIKFPKLPNPSPSPQPGGPNLPGETEPTSPPDAKHSKNKKNKKNTKS